MYANAAEHSTVMVMKKRGLHQIYSNEFKKMMQDSEMRMTPKQMRRRMLQQVSDHESSSTIVVPSAKSLANCKYRFKLKMEQDFGLLTIKDLDKWIDESINHFQQNVSQINDNEMVILSKIDYIYIDEETRETVSAPGFVFSSKNCIKNFIESCKGSNSRTSDGTPLIGLNGDATFNLFKEKWCMISVGPRAFLYDKEDISHHYRPGTVLCVCFY